MNSVGVLMGSSKRLSAVAINELKDALTTIYWYKRDLQSFLQNCISDASVFSNVNWSSYKRQIASDAVDALCSDQDRYLGDLRKLINEVCLMDNFQHLEKLEDGKKKAQEAQTAVTRLRKRVKTHDEGVAEQKKAIEKRQEYAAKMRLNQGLLEKLDKLKQSYVALVSATNPHRRGYELETLLYNLFNLFDLDPKASFKNAGEQIDGSFTLDGTDYLFEAKWQQDLVQIQDLDAFAGKVNRKLDNTLGLFLSMNGFSPTSVEIHSTGRPVLILMTGADLMAVLDDMIDFKQLLQRKRRHASQTGNILFGVHEML